MSLICCCRSARGAGSERADQRPGGVGDARPGAERVERGADQLRVVAEPRGHGGRRATPPRGPTHPAQEGTSTRHHLSMVRLDIISDPHNQILDPLPYFVKIELNIHFDITSRYYINSKLNFALKSTTLF